MSLSGISRAGRSVLAGLFLLVGLTVSSGAWAVTTGFVFNTRSGSELSPLQDIAVLVRPNPGHSAAITIPLICTDVTATRGTDYTCADSVTIPANTVFHEFQPFTLIPDMDVEGPETFTVRLDWANATPDVITGVIPGLPTRYDTITYTIGDSPVASFRTQASTVNEGDGTYRVFVDFSESTVGSFSLIVSASGSATIELACGDTAAVADANWDYNLLRFSDSGRCGGFVIDNSDRKTLELTINDDTRHEGTETIELRLATENIEGYIPVTGAGAMHTVTITDNDSPPRRDRKPSFGASAVENQNWTRGEAIAPLSLPVATGGDGTLTYSLSPAPPTGMTLDTSAHSLSGAPAQAQAATQYVWTATDADGDTTTLEFTIAIAEVAIAEDLMPSFGASAVENQSWTRGEAITPLSLPVATGGDGTLTYSLSPAPPAGVTLDTSARSLSGAPAQAQAATRYVWTATDEDGDAATLAFTIAIAENITRMQGQVLRPALAAMARLSLSSALENIGARFGDFGADGLTLAGHAVPMSATGLPEALRPCSPVLTDPAATSSTDCRFHSRGWSSSELLRASDFTLSLDASDPASGAARWSIWGRGDWGSFTGNGTEPQTRHEGELQSGWLGMDARAKTWVTGLAFSRSEGETDYRMEGDEGRLETTLNGVYPYGRWTLDNGLELRAVLGAGQGEARHQPQGSEAMSSDLSMWMGSFGLRRPLAPADGFDLALRLEASRARLRTAAGLNPIDGLVADSWRLRAAVEASKRFIRASGAELEPFLEAAVRRDRGELEGGGVELAGGLRYGRPGLLIEARGRWLAAHRVKGAKESGASVTVRGGAGASGRGLWFALEPRWGAGTGTLALWDAETPRIERDVSDHSMDARMGYGVMLPDAGGVLTPFTGVVLSGEDRRAYQFGTRFDSSATDFGMEVVGERTEDADAANAPEHTLKFNLRYRF